jgi:hypothetical protein
MKLIFLRNNMIIFVFLQYIILCENFFSIFIPIMIIMHACMHFYEFYINLFHNCYIIY